jgi:sulfur carrier protein ThiS
MTEIKLDVWLYGALGRYGGDPEETIFANVKPSMPAGCTLKNLLDSLDLPTEERGITFINGELSAMPGMQPDLTHELKDGDRIALFHLKSMWPFQYRHGVPMIGEMSEAMNESKDQGLHHTYK